jgi:hypothetical protein
MTGAMVDVLFLLTMTKVFDDGDETVKKYELAVRVPMERAAQEFQAKFGEVGSVKFVARAMPAAAFFNEQQKPQSPTSPAKQNHSNDTIQSPHKQQQTQETATVVEPTESGSITVHDEANEFSSRCIETTFFGTAPTDQNNTDDTIATTTTKEREERPSATPAAGDDDDDRHSERGNSPAGESAAFAPLQSDDVKAASKQSSGVAASADATKDVQNATAPSKKVTEPVSKQSDKTDAKTTRNAKRETDSLLEKTETRKQCCECCVIA